MKYIYILLIGVFTILFSGCLINKATASNKQVDYLDAPAVEHPVCPELREGQEVIVPVTMTLTSHGVIVISDRNPDTCERLYLMLLDDIYGRPFFIHSNDIPPQKSK